MVWHSGSAALRRLPLSPSETRRTPGSHGTVLGIVLGSETRTRRRLTRTRSSMRHPRTQMRCGTQMSQT
eukprot:3941213-Rhodomonas_salina.1